MAKDTLGELSPRAQEYVQVWADEQARRRLSEQLERDAGRAASGGDEDAGDGAAD